MIEILKSKHLCSIFNMAIADYHLFDNIDAFMPSHTHFNDFEHTLYRKAWIDTVQWHLEDIIRDPQIDPVYALQLKRRIDRSNQDRTDCVEQMDVQIAQVVANPDSNPESTPINTESPGWALDRLSILQLKIYHMKEQVNEANSKPDLLKELQQKFERLLLQNHWLCKAIDQLIGEIIDGKRVALPYEQMKMYNDERLNPILKSKSPVS
jgi:hypothetical protein